MRCVPHLETREQTRQEQVNRVTKQNTTLMGYYTDYVLIVSAHKTITYYTYYTQTNNAAKYKEC